MVHLHGLLSSPLRCPAATTAKRSLLPKCFSCPNTSQPHRCQHQCHILPIKQLMLRRRMQCLTAHTVWCGHDHAHVVVRMLLVCIKKVYIDTTQGLGHVVGYAGDGINDVEALRAADVGVAIGTGAVIAASVYTPANSLHGTHMTLTSHLHSVCWPSSMLHLSASASHS